MLESELDDTMKGLSIISEQQAIEKNKAKMIEAKLVVEIALVKDLQAKVAGLSDDVA